MLGLVFMELIMRAENNLQLLGSTPAQSGNEDAGLNFTPEHRGINCYFFISLTDNSIIDTLRITI